MQYTGFSPTTELDAFRRFDIARDVDDVREALQYFDVGAQHFIYADRRGDIAYLTNAEVPIREDLQAGQVRETRLPAARRHRRKRWLPVKNPQPHQSVPYEILPFREMSQTVNPPSGFVVSANNDPTGNTFDNNVLNEVRPGGGIFYLGFFQNGSGPPRHRHGASGCPQGTDHGGRRRGHAGGHDHRRRTVLCPGHHRRAHPRARSSTPQLAALARDPRSSRRSAGSAGGAAYPTGIPEGYDAADRNGRLTPRRRGDRPQRGGHDLHAVARPLRQRLDGTCSGLPQLPVPGDLQTPQALKRCCWTSTPVRAWAGPASTSSPSPASPTRRPARLPRAEEPRRRARPRRRPSLAPVFGGSTRQSDYRWGKLHRITLTSPLGAPYTVPSQGNRLTSPLPGLPGLPVDGGSNVPDVAGHPLRADAPEKFIVPCVPDRKFVAQATPEGWRSVDTLPGGVSEDLGSRFDGNLLGDWLTNETLPVRMYPGDLAGGVELGDAVRSEASQVGRPSQSSLGLSGSVAARSQDESWYRIIAIIVGRATSAPEIAAAAREWSKIRIAATAAVAPASTAVHRRRPMPATVRYPCQRSPGTRCIRSRSAGGTRSRYGAISGACSK